MLSLVTTPTEEALCYFSIRPSGYIHFSTETPFYTENPNEASTPADPSNPLLAYREPRHPSPPTSPLLGSQSTFFQMQTAAAHKSSPGRPRPYPVQNVLHVTSDDSSSGDDSETSIEQEVKPPMDSARCSRCQRSGSCGFKHGGGSMIQYGLNLWYCTRCAGLVGLINR